MRTLKTKTSQHQRINVKNENISSINQPILKIQNIVEAVKNDAIKTSQNVPHLGSLEGRLELDIIELLLAELVNKMKESACHITWVVSFSNPKKEKVIRFSWNN